MTFYEELKSLQNRIVDSIKASLDGVEYGLIGKPDEDILIDEDDEFDVMNSAIIDMACGYYYNRKFGDEPVNVYAARINNGELEFLFGDDECDVRTWHRILLNDEEDFNYHIPVNQLAYIADFLKKNKQELPQHDEFKSSIKSS